MVLIFAARKILGLRSASTELRARQEQRRFMGFPVTVVLGASGRIGRVLQHCWPRSAALAGAEIRWQSRHPLPAHPGNQPEMAGFELLDPLADPRGLAQLCAGAEAVLCLAGSIPGRGNDLADNSRLACAAVQAAAQGAALSGRPAARVLLSSSVAVYGNQPGRLSEDNTLQPANAYGVAKQQMEQEAQALGTQLGVAVTALRIGNIAGLDACLGGWRPGFSLDQFADQRSPRRSYIGPITLAQILAALVAMPKLPPVLNLAQPGALEMADLLRRGLRAFAWRPAPAEAIAQVELDLTRLQAALQESPLPPAQAAGATAQQMLAEWAEIEPILATAPLPSHP